MGTDTCLYLSISFRWTLSRDQQTPGPNGALHVLGFGRGFSHEYEELTADMEPESVMVRNRGDMKDAAEDDEVTSLE